MQLMVQRRISSMSGRTQLHHVSTELDNHRAASEEAWHGGTTASKLLGCATPYTGGVEQPPWMIMAQLKPWIAAAAAINYGHSTARTAGRRPIL